MSALIVGDVVRVIGHFEAIVIVKRTQHQLALFEPPSNGLVALRPVEATGKEAT